jgi:DNA primase
VKKASDCLWTTDGKDALKYLMEERGLSETALRQFQIGFVPLYVQHQCRGRLIYPIHDVYGDLVAISTRHLTKPKNEAFWHEDFEKSFYLYGMHQARSGILRRRKALVVEGELDVAFFHTHGVDFTVGLMGSSLTAFHIALLGRYATDIYLLFDGDKGGKTAYERCKVMYDQQLQGIVNLIPTRITWGSDPDDFLEAEGVKGLADLMISSKEQFTQFGYA